MSEAKVDPKTQVERLKSEYGAEDLGTYMDARVEEKVIRVAVWNEGLKSYQPTDEGIALLNTPSPKEKKEKAEKEKPAAATKPGAKAAETPAPTPPPPMPPQPVPPATPAGTRPPTG